MGMQSASVQQPYSSAPQGKGQGLPNPQAQMSPNQPPETFRDQMMRKFPQGNTGIVKPQDTMQTGGFKGSMGDGSVQSSGPVGEITGGMPMGGPFSHGNTGVVGPNQNTGPFYHPPTSGAQTDLTQVPKQSTAPTDGSVGKGQGAQGAVTFPGQGKQPQMGQPNPYPNTINPSDNTGMVRNQQMGSGKSGGSAKGAQ